MMKNPQFCFPTTRERRTVPPDRTSVNIRVRVSTWRLRAGLWLLRGVMRVLARLFRHGIVYRVGRHKWTSGVHMHIAVNTTAAS